MRIRMKGLLITKFKENCSNDWVDYWYNYKSWHLNQQKRKKHLRSSDQTLRLVTLKATIQQLMDLVIKKIEFLYLVILFYNPGHNILELYNILLQIRFTTSKRKFDIQYSNLVHELPHELPNNLRLRILGNQKISEKYQIWVDTQPSVQSPCKNLNFANSS